jgi:hypothetical protein
MSPIRLTAWLAELRGRARALFGRDTLERDLGDEIRFHLEMETEANIHRGMSPEEARRRARLAFGGVERVREEHRDARGLRLLGTLPPTCVTPRAGCGEAPASPSPLCSRWLWG